MQSLQQIGAGILLSACSVLIVLGGLALALAEGGMASGIPATNTVPTGEIITVFPTLPLSFTNTPRGADFTATASLTPPPTLISCPPPAGWLPIVIQPYDTLDSLAQTYHSTVDVLQKSNCLLNQKLVANSILYVPPQPTSTLKPCGPPFNWGTYTVRAGDTLYGISLLYHISWQELMQANCLDTTYIKTGQVLRVPNLPTSIPPVPTDTAIPTLTQIPAVTLTPSMIPPTPTETLPATTEVPSPTTAPSNTPIPSETPTPTNS